MLLTFSFAALLSLGSTNAFFSSSENTTTITLQNERMYFALTKATGQITSVTLDNDSLLGESISSTTAVGPYVDAMFTPKQTLVTLGSAANHTLITGKDSQGVKWGGFVLSQDNVDSVDGATLQQYWFLREKETSLHGFSRIAYYGDVENLAILTQIRTLFRPHGTFWTHLSATDDFYAAQPNPNPAVASADTGVATLVQDTTWYLGNRSGDPWVTQEADYWTKYSMTDTYRDHVVHGLFADGSRTPGNSTYGAWMVYNSKDTFYGATTYSDLTVDGLLYNIMMSNHHGNTSPNITKGFDRTFGPSIYHFNKGPANQDVDAALNALRKDAAQYAPVTSSHAKFYDDIAPFVTGYVTTAHRGAWSGKIHLPWGARNPVAILSAPGYDFQDNAYDVNKFQYWASVNEQNGKVEINRVVPGTYRLTVYAEGIFGDYVYENITITAGRKTNTPQLLWNAESAGTELWRIGTPDRSAGEFKHGYARDPNHSGHIPEFRVYWGAYDFVDDFPTGVNYTIGKSSEADDFNYVHWSVYGASHSRPGTVAGPAVSDWTINFDLTAKQLKKRKTATLTIQFAGVGTEAGNTDIGGSTWSDLPYNVAINGNHLETFVVPHYHSSSCSVRSGIICYGVRNKWTFPASQLSSTTPNKLVLSMPMNASAGSVSPTSLSAMYDAIRLEVS